MAAPIEVVLGGTFDPVHVGHLELAAEIRGVLELPRVLLLPAAFPPHKPLAAITPARHREAMLRLAVWGCDGIEICTLELDSGEVCYTIDSLRRLRGGPPVRRPVFVLGMDALAEIPTWRQYTDLLREFDFLVIDRPGAGDATVLDRLHPRVLERLQPRLVPARARQSLGEARLGDGGRIFRIGIATTPVSSSQVRSAVANGQRLDGLVPPRVAGYIQAHGLYHGRTRAE